MPHRASWVSRWSAYSIELGWLAAMFCIPSFFNLLSSRHFEPDKALLFRFIILLITTFVVINSIDEHQSTKTNKNLRWWQHYSGYPLMIAILSYCGVFLLSTITSIVPDVSFWGSYQRLQGTYTNLSYVLLALVMVRYIADYAQIWRAVGTLLLGSLIPTLYGYVQYLEMDPLPWKGDVITRVASTLGNSIFIAAYLILIVPFALAFGVRQWRMAQSAPHHRHANTWLWLLGHASTIVAIVTVIFGGMQMSAVIRSIDTIYWWIYPGAIVSGFTATLLLTNTLHNHPRFRPVWITPAIIITTYTIICQVVGLSVQDSFSQPDSGRFGMHWNWWLWASTFSAWVGVTAYIQAPYGITPPKQYAYTIALSSFGLAIANWVTIILSQSRGPWIGGAVGVFLFFVLVTQLQMRTNTQFARRAKRLLISIVVLFATLFGFLLLFNFADIPSLRPLRDLPYIGRMGRLFDISPGTTGDVRMKIWFGDQFGTGTTGLILSNPLRTVIGWGPESMFAAYTPFYPPSLANIESRSATPDRSHQAFLDELVNKGILGLVSYLTLIFLALRIALRRLRQPAQHDEQLLIIAIISAIAAHLVEGLTGIPIVTSLMIQWIAIALLIIIDNPQPHTTEQPIIDTAPTKPSKSGRSKAPTPNIPTATPTAQYIGYVAILAVGLYVGWSSNINNMYADMRFQQGQTYNSSASATNNTDQQIIALSHYLAAVRLAPHQDYYFLNIGRSLLSLADAQRRTNNSTTSNHSPTLQGLIIQPDALALKQYLAPLSARDITRYAEESLLRAHQLYPRNKDHSANLARLYLFWFNRIEQDPALLETAIQWFDQSVNIAPNDVAIINDYASALINYAIVIRSSNPTYADELIARAETQLNNSLQRDQRYRDTIIRLGDLARAKTDYVSALQYYDQALTLNPRALDSQIVTIINQLAPDTNAHEFLLQLRQIYERVRPADNTTILAIMGLISSRINDSQGAIDAFALLTTLQPDNIEAQQNYTLVLSNAMQYESAFRASERLYALAEQSGYPASSLDLYATLREYLDTKRTP